MAQSKCEARVRRGSSPPAIDPTPLWATRFLDYARISAIVYRSEPGSIPDPQGWKRIKTLDDAETSLYLEVWLNGEEGVIAFRGTQEPKDWWSNARWITRFIPAGWDQYDLVRSRIASLLEEAKSKGARRFTATGHSLGGGLAQQAAYAHPDIKYVVAFDPSPVTGFRSVPQAERDRNKQAIEIFRAYEKGEILAFFRRFLRRFLPLSSANPTITEVRFNLTKGDPVKQHNMSKLARQMESAIGEC